MVRACLYHETMVQCADQQIGPCAQGKRWVYVCWEGEDRRSEENGRCRLIDLEFQRLADDWPTGDVKMRCRCSILSMAQAHCVHPAACLFVTVSTTGFIKYLLFGNNFHCSCSLLLPSDWHNLGHIFGFYPHGRFLCIFSFVSITTQHFLNHVGNQHTKILQWGHFIPGFR